MPDSNTTLVPASGPRTQSKSFPQVVWPEDSSSLIPALPSDSPGSLAKKAPKTKNWQMKPRKEKSSQPPVQAPLLQSAFELTFSTLLSSCRPENSCSLPGSSPSLLSEASELHEANSRPGDPRHMVPAAIPGIRALSQPPPWPSGQWSQVLISTCPLIRAKPCLLVGRAWECSL